MSAPSATDRGTPPPASDHLEFRIGAVGATISADAPAFLSYARRHMAPLLTSGPGSVRQISSQLRWHERPPRSRADLVAGIDAMERPDRDLYISSGRMAWFRIDDFRHLVLQARCDGTTLHVQGDYHFFLNRSPWRDRLRRLLESRSIDQRREKRFATLLYYLAYYPVMWWHESFADSHPLHAAGVVGERGALVLAGPSGVGKSTLTVALTAAGGRPLSETFLLHTGRNMVAIAEPVLLDAWSQRWLDDGGALLTPMAGHFVFDRRGYHLGGTAAQAPAVAVVLPRRAQPAGVAQISADEAHRRISTGHQLVKDMRRYWAFAAAFENLAASTAGGGLMQRRESALAELTRDVPCWELRLAPDLTRAAVTEMLADISQRSGGGGLAAPPIQAD